MCEHQRFRDRHYLRTHHYRDSGKLSARIALHERFSTNKHGWHRWVFDHLRLPPASHLLEIGCGAGTLWWRNVHRLPEGWEITLSDLSLGMLLDARRALAALSRPFCYVTADALAIPFPQASFDCVIANHMLYHVPSTEKAFEEIHRVLKPGGRLFAATNGSNHLRELRRLVTALDRNLKWPGPASEGFSLENGQAQLSRWFTDVVLHRYPDSLLITEAEPLVAYLGSILPELDSPLASERLTAFRALVEDQLRRHGPLRITKDAGLFTAHRTDEAQGRRSLGRPALSVAEGSLPPAP